MEVLFEGSGGEQQPGWKPGGERGQKVPAEAPRRGTWEERVEAFTAALVEVYPHELATEMSTALRLESFANFVGRAAEETGVEVTEVLRQLGETRRFYASEGHHGSGEGAYTTPAMFLLSTLELHVRRERAEGGEGGRNSA